MDKNSNDIPSFFISWLNGQTFYRPLSREVFNLLMYKSFGLNPLAFHIINMILILIIAYLSYYFVKCLTNNTVLSWLVVILYSLSSVHNIELYYLPSVQTLFATVFMMISLICYLKFLNFRDKKEYIISLISFTLAILSHESSVILPLFILVLTLSKSKKIKLGSLLPFFLISSIRIFLLIALKNLPNQQVYQPMLNLKSILNTFMWYTLWNFNLPEILPDFIGSGFKINPNFLKWYGQYSLIIFPLVSLLVLFLSVSFLKFKKTLFKDKEFFLILCFYFISLTPFLFFPQHKFVYYLTFPLIWFTVLVSIVLSKWNIRKLSSKVFLTMFLISFGVIGYQTNQLNSITYWAAKRANAAKFLLADIHLKFPVIKPDESFYIVSDPNYPFIANEWGTSAKQASYILSGEDALKLLYKNPGLRVYYEGLNELKPEEKMIPYMAKFPY